MWDFTVNVFRRLKPERRRRPALGMQRRSETLANLPRWSVHKVSLIYIRSIHYSNNCDLLRKYRCGHWTVWAREPERVTRGEQLESLDGGGGAWRMTRPTGSMNANVQPGDGDPLWDCAVRRWCSTCMAHEYTNTHKRTQEAMHEMPLS